MMESELNLVADLALILVSAGIFTIISKALKQPLVLGYIIAGFLIGPHFGLFPTVQSTGEVDLWSEIGIIFLMFALGLEFSFRKLMKVGGSAIIIAGCKFIGIFVLGMLVGSAMGFSLMESVFLGGLLSMSSTAVVVKAYDDFGLKKKPYASIVFGMLVVEDIIAILLMVLLSTMGISHKFAGGEMLLNLAKLAFFLILWFLVGIYVIPTVFKKARNYINDEILLIVSIGLCFGMVSLATLAGFSSALGAFVMGSILAETVEGEHIHKLVGGIKDLFSAVFFVSVGMMVDPVVIAQNWWMILILVFVVIVGHILFAAAGAVLAGKGLENAIHAGFSVSQLGEFGFILAGLGVSLGVMRGFIYPVIIAVSVITTFTTPYMIKLAGPAVKLAYAKLPAKWIARLDSQDEGISPTSKGAQNLWKELIKAYLTRVVLYGVILVAIVIGSGLYLEPLILKLFPTWTPFVQSVVSVCLTIAVMMPFLYGLAVNSGSITTPATRLLKERRSNVWPILFLVFLRIFLAIGFILAVVISHFSISFWVILLIIVAGAAFALIARMSVHRFAGLEKKFLENLNEREEQSRRAAPLRTSLAARLSGYDVHVDGVDIVADCSFVGQKIKDLQIRKLSGANVAKIVRGNRNINVPTSDELIFPGDRIVVVGTEGQIAAFMKMVADATPELPAEPQSDTFSVEPVTLSEDSPIVGKTLGEIRMRDYGCMIVSILHEGEFITNPRPEQMFSAGDVVWIAGESQDVDWFRR